MEEDGAILEGGPRKRMKRMRYKLLEQSWGEDRKDGEDDQEEGCTREPIVSSPPMAPTSLVGGSNMHRSSSKTLSSSKITDFFPVLKTKRMAAAGGMQDLMRIEELWEVDNEETSFLLDLCGDHPGPPTNTELGCSQVPTVGHVHQDPTKHMGIAKDGLLEDTTTPSWSPTHVGDGWYFNTITTHHPP